MKLTKTKTNRGFKLTKFTDLYDNECSIQESSLATDDAIWVGIDDANPVIMESDARRLGIEKPAADGWVKYPIPYAVIMHTRMHLTRKMVAKLLPVLQKFVDTGEL